MHTLEPNVPPGFKPEPLTARIFVRCYRRYGDAKRAYDQLRVVAGIPDQRMTVVARGLEWRETLPGSTLFKLALGLGALTGATVGLALWLLGLTAAQTGWLTQTVLAGLAGVVVGFVVAAIVGRLRQRRTGVAETGHVEPRQYDILVEEQFASAAHEVLGDG